MSASLTTPETDQAILVLTSFPDEHVAKAIANQLVTEKLAACVSLVPQVHSIYLWEGQLQQENEWLGLIKTRQGLYQVLAQRLQAMHPYDTPEILHIAIADTAPRYLAWIIESVAPRAERSGHVNEPPSKTDQIVE